jgi:hypothetical protein
MCLKAIFIVNCLAQLYARGKGWGGSTSDQTVDDIDGILCMIKEGIICKSNRWLLCFQGG